MVYPDGEELSYTYNTGGLLRSMSGKRLGHRYNYLTQLGYDKFENRVYLSYGNGTETTYDYEDDRRRLQHITATTSNGRMMMDNTYTYDKVNNIMSLTNDAPKVTPNKKGGPFEYSYQYDDLYRLIHAEGDWKGATHEHRYELEMQYSPTGRILHKTQTHDRMSYDEPGTWVPQHKTTYDWEYKYEGSQPHAATHIGENTYTYDDNGNQTGWTNDKNGQRRQILWDEENRMRAIADNGTTHHYIYDAGGERVIKSHGDGQAIYVNGFPMGGSGTVGNYIVYVNPFMVFQNAKYTKHFYIEGQRIVSKLGEMGTEQALLNPKSHAGDSLKAPIKWNDKKELSKDIIIANFEALGLGGAVFTSGKSGKMPYGQIKKYYRNTDAVINPGTSTASGKKTQDLQFYYHPDHLGSSNYITDISGEVYQHQEYFPFGETFVEERNDAEYTNFLYNSKELDEETGLYYYGARYYDARISIWLSVDPLAEKYISWSPFHYTANNPIFYRDKNGETWDPSIWDSRPWYDVKKYIGGPTMKGTDYQHFLTENSFQKAKNAVYAMNKMNTAFNSAWNDVQASSLTYTINEVAYNNSPGENGSLTGTSIKLSQNKFDHATIFEEVFHAAQMEMYSVKKQNTPNTLISIEVEAKVAKALTGVRDQFGMNKDMKEYYKILKDGGTISSELRGRVNASLVKYAEILVAPQSEGGLGYTHLSSQLSSFKPEETMKYFESIYDSK